MSRRGAGWCPSSYRARRNAILALQACAAGVLLLLAFYGAGSVSAPSDGSRRKPRPQPDDWEGLRPADAWQAVSPPVAADARLAAGRGEPEPAAFAEPETAPPPGEAEAEAPEEPPARAPPQAAAAQAPALLPRAPAPTAPLALASDGGVGSEALRGQHDGSHPHEGPTKLIFIRIPLNGGRSLVDAAQREGLHFGDHVQASTSSKGPRSVVAGQTTCPRASVPPSQLAEVYGGTQTFCIVRDPYERLITEFRRTWKGNPLRKVGCLDGLNAFVKKRVKTYMGDPELGREPAPFAHECDFMPQSAFVFGWRADVGQVDDTQRWCTHSLHHANLQEDASTFLESHGYRLTVEAEPLVDPSVCPMLNLRSLSVVSRELIEAAYKDDFRLLNFQKITGPEFIHIPRTGGTTIEDVSQKYELWGRRSPRLLGGAKWMGPKHMDVCYPQHVPPSILDALFAGKETFCIVRDVYKRLISEFGYWAMARFPGWPPQFDCNVSELNRFISERLAGKDGYLHNPHRSDCHLVPQAGFVYAWDRKNAKVNFGERWCTKVVRYERFHEEINSFWAGHGYPMRLDTGQRSWTKTKGPCGELKPKHFSDESVALIKKVYFEDFKMMADLDAEYESAPKTPPLPAEEVIDDDHLIRVAERTLVAEERELEKATMVVDDLVTSEDFEVEFDLTLHKVYTSNVGGILKITNTSGWYGEPGDRMPAFLFGWNSSKIMTHMGKAGKPNDFCQSKYGMPLGKVQHILARLQGSEYTMYVNGEESCTLRGFSDEAKYPAQRNVQVWLYDQFNDPGFASIANLRYKALGSLPA